MTTPAVSLAPWLVELSNKYYTAARLLAQQGNLLGVAQINAALSVEILIKSFLVEATSDFGTVHERYRFRALYGAKAHNLTSLYRKLPREVRRSVFSPSNARWLNKYKNTFTNARYEYEEGAPLISDSILIEVAGELIPRVVDFYRRQGSRDPWILSYKAPTHPYGLVSTQ